MDREVYEQNLHALLDDGMYTKLRCDLTSKIETEDLAGQTSSFVKENVTEFAHNINNMSIPDGTIMVSFDVN